MEQQLENLAVGVYEQQGSVLKFGEEGFFSDTSEKKPVKIEDGRLQLHFASNLAGTPLLSILNR